MPSEGSVLATLAFLGLLDLVDDVGFARIGRAGGGLRRGGRQHAGRVAGRRRERAERRARLEQDIVQGGRAGRRVVSVHIVELAEEVERVARGLERDQARPRGRLVRRARVVRHLHHQLCARAGGRGGGKALL